MNSDLQSLTESLRDFAKARDWEQFHSPKNLAAALTVETAELLELSSGWRKLEPGKVVLMAGDLVLYG
jgi:NTP pyrophosphatase (non-canonical NTP hydrolase)